MKTAQRQNPFRPWLARPAGVPRIVGVAVVLLALAGCAPSGGGKGKLSAAAERLARDDVVGALIEAKAVLKNHPESAAARLLLGRALLAGGQTDNAEIELRRAAELGASEGELSPVLATLYRTQRNPQRTIDTFAATVLQPPAAQAALQVEVALAHMTLGQPEDALKAAEAALQNVPDQPDARLIQARVAAALGKFAEAGAGVTTLLTRTPGHAGALVLKGELLAREKNHAAALESYRAALRSKPGLDEAHSLLISLLLGTHDLPGARAAADAYVKSSPAGAEAGFYQGLVAYVSNDFVRAREATQRLLRGNIESPQVLFLAGMTEWRLGSLAQAEALLGRAMLATPDALAPRLNLAALHQESSRPASTLETLQPWLTQNLANPTVWRLAGEAFAMTGAFRKADAAFARARQLGPNDPKVMTSQGKALLARGEVDRGLSELEAVARTDPSGIEAELAVIATRMKQGNVAAALGAVDGLATKQPAKPTADLLRGRIHEQQGDRGAARKAYEASLVKQAGFAPALDRLVALDIQDGQMDAARKRYATQLKSKAPSSAAMLGMADIVMRTGGSRQEVSEWLDKAVKVNPADGATWLAALKMQIASGDLPNALNRALAAAAAAPADPDLLVQVGRIQAASKDYQQALATLNSAAQARPQHVPAQLALSELQDVRGNPAAARQHAQRALGVEPDNPAAIRQLMALLLKAQDVPGQTRLVSELQSRRPLDPLGWQLAAEAFAARADWPKALDSMRKALSLGETSPMAIQYHVMLQSAAQGAQATAWEQTWLKKRPDDPWFMVHLAQRASRAKDWAVARKIYQQVAKQDQVSAPVLNNLAYAMAQLKDPAAIEVAVSAVRLEPWNAEILDTLAFAYAVAGKKEKAVQAQTRAVVLAPQSGQLRLNLSRLLLAAGEKTKAREELQKLERMGADFPDQPAVQQLLKAAA